VGGYRAHETFVVHALCDRCWFDVRSEEPARFLIDHRRTETCCSCGSDTLSGIYTREAPTLMSFCQHERAWS